MPKGSHISDRWDSDFENTTVDALINELCATPDMEEHSGEEALDCLYSIYKVIQLMQYSDPSIQQI